MKFPIRKIALIALTSLAIHLNIPAAYGSTPVNQGDRIRFTFGEGRSSCTAGYIDSTNSRIWTAGHCADNDVDAFNKEGERIGTFKHRYSIKDRSSLVPPRLREEAMLRYQFYDIGYIELAQPNFAGQNHFSGDRPYTPEIGEEICRFGATTKTINCGVILRIDDHLIYAIDLKSRPGDSGGPNWVPGKGYVGQTLGTNSIANSEGFRAITTVIHREDLNHQIMHLPTDAPLPENEPSYEELISFDTKVREKLESFGANMPTASELSGILRNHEAALNKASEEARKTREALNEAVQDIEIRRQSAARYEAQIKKLETEHAKAQAELDRVKAVIDLGDIEAKGKEITRLNGELHKQKTIYMTMTAFISLIIGVIAGIGGWIAHMLTVKGIIRS